MLAEQLDYEAVQKYTLIIGATDMGVPRYSSNLTVNLEVQDVNDNPPVFEKASYTISVLESMPANSQFLQVTAVDQDTGNNARLTYTIKEKEFENVFGVFPNSGSLYLKEVSRRRTSVDVPLSGFALCALYLLCYHFERGGACRQDLMFPMMLFTPGAGSRDARQVRADGRGDGQRDSRVHRVHHRHHQRPGRQRQLPVLLEAGRNPIRLRDQFLSDA